MVRDGKRVPAPQAEPVTDTSTSATESFLPHGSAALLWLQRNAGNNAVTRLLGEPDRLRPAIEQVLIDASKIVEYDFAAHLVGAISATDTEAAATARRIAVTETTVDDESYDIPAVLLTLDGLHRNVTGLDGVTVSAGLRHVIRTLATDAAETVATADFSELDNDMAQAAGAIEDANALLRLELTGTIDELIDQRRRFATAEGDTRAQLGAEIGVSARKALLLNKSLQEEDDQTAPLETEVEQRASDIARIRTIAQTEDDTTAQLGDQLALLTQHQVTDNEDATAVVEPEVALPEITDAAELKFAEQLSARISDQRADVAHLHDRVVPDHPTYELAEFAAVHKRWFSLTSGAQEKQDPVVKLALDLMGEPYRVAGADVGGGVLKAEGGVARAFLMNMAVDMMSGSLTGETNQFGDQIDGSRRRAATTGTASAPEYDYGELYPGKSTDEVVSRKEFQQRRQLETATTATALAAVPDLVRPSAVPIVGLRATNASEGWSYLVDVYSQENLVAREHKVVPPEVAQYLLAAHQQAETLAKPHIPTVDGSPIGSRAMRTAGVEGATATSTERYLDGEQTTEVPDEITVLRGQLSAGSGPTDGEALTEQLGRDLRTYLEAFFAERQSMEYRVAAVFAIGDTEHAVGNQLSALLEPSALAAVIGEAVKISAITLTLGGLGPLGMAASQAYKGYLGTQGINDVAALVSIAAFCRNAATADSLSKARAWGYMTVNIAQDAEQLLTTVVASPVTAGLTAITTAKPTTALDLADAVRPLMNDPATRENLLRDVESQIAALESTGQSNAELKNLKAFHDGLLQRSSVDLVDGVLPTTAVDTGLFTHGRGRSEADLTALRNALGGDTDLVENATLTGTTVHVRYGDDSKVRVEIGPAVEPAHIRQHLETVRQLRRFEGVVGRLRQLLSEIRDLITGHPSYGTEGFEARLEVQKLRGIEVDLLAQLRGVEALNDRLTGQDDGDPASVRLQLEAIQSQLQLHESNVDSYREGRGFIAAEDTSPAMNAARERAKRMIEAAEAVAPDVRATLGDAVAAHGAKLARLDTEIKDEMSLTSKIYDRATVKGPPTDVVLDKVTAKIDDVLRYTVVADTLDYMRVCAAVRAELEAAGYTYVKEGNAWAEPEKFGGYRGINMKFRTKDGLLFEVQFHTTDSLALADETHALYEELRNPATTEKRKEELRQEMRRRANLLPVPDGADQL
ncbi:hypothetical protein [Actinocrispum wychmicini]|uniref:RelA/SpoT domain-containing protein n=1 Tax=Actinocrispum wychmicini TaxID=1213861 RepID=A0A4R2J947_9PSEU|nr:hypothetical protein [Actinocrispum wychmicini]TCO55224.1 hypothetical protein EV192_108514 [Actinocrispum wychmicini]